MSRTIINKIYRRTVVPVKEYNNALKAAFLVWTTVGKLCERPYVILFNTDFKWHEIWKNPKLTEEQRAVLLWTYDYNIVCPENIPRFREALLAMHKTISNYDVMNSHLEEMACDLKYIDIDQKCLGIGLTVSTNNDLWDHYRSRRTPRKDIVIDYVNQLIDE